VYCNVKLNLTNFVTEITDFYLPDEQEAEDYFNNRLNKIISDKNIGNVKSCIIL